MNTCVVSACLGHANFWVGEVSYILLWLKGKFYRTAIRPALLYGTDCWDIKRHHAQKMSVAEMRMLCWMCDNTRRDNVRNEDIRTKIGAASIEEKRETRLRWLGLVRRRQSINLGQVKRAQGRPKETWMEVIRQDIEAKGLSEGILLDRNEWRKLIHVPDLA